MPIYAIFFLFFTMANIALPGTSSFIGEFLLLLGIYGTNTFAAVFSTTGVILSGGYSLWLYNRVMYGNLKVQNTLFFQDLSFREFSILWPLSFFVLLFGVYPNFLLNFFHAISTKLYMYIFF